MAPQLVSFCLAAIALLAIGAQAQELSIVAYVPFQSMVPPISTPPGLAGFKDRFKQAFQESLQYINDVTGAGLGSAPSIKAIVPDWVYTEASAMATFPYTEEWLGPIQYLVAAPQTFYYYDNDTSSAGFKLINIYEALPEGTTFDIVVASPPPPMGTGSPPPSPPPPIFPKPNAAPPPSNDTITFRVVSSLYSASIPNINDTANFTIFLNTFYASFATMLDCASANSNSSAFNATAGVNSTAIADLCYSNGTSNSTNFPSVPTSANVTQTLIPNPLNTTAVASRRRHLLDAPTGFVYNVTIVATYGNISITVATVYGVAQASIVVGQKGLIVITLQINDLIVVQIGLFIDASGGAIPFTPEVPAYGASVGGGRRRMIERRTATVSTNDIGSVNWASAEPSDVAYGTDKSLYEIFSAFADYYTAGAACAARGAKLASYSSEGAQIFIDILCDGAAGMQCWVEGNANGACNAVSSSVVHPLSCGKKMPFVCVKDKSAIRTVSTASETVAELAQEKPTDVAYDTNKNLYEIFSTPVNYHTAGSVCLARGAQLANYGTEASQVFIDVLCEAASGQTCWVEGNKAGRCSAVKASDVHQVSCTGLQPFVCTKKAIAKKIQ
jgi:hypothetical protein